MAKKVTKQQIPKKKFAASEPFGAVGTAIYGGYFLEETLQDLRGKNGMDMYDKMRRSDYQCSMILKAFKSPIISADWNINNDIDDYVYNILFKNPRKPFKRLLKEILTFAEFGHSIFEKWFTLEEFGIMPNLGYRKQNTIREWNIVKENLVSIHQVCSYPTFIDVTLPAENLVIFTPEQEGANFEGISVLRAAYGCWLRKNLLLKLQIMGLEKSALGIPIAEVPSGKDNSPEREMLIKALTNYTSHAKSHIIHPSGWKIELFKNEFDAEKVDSAIQREDTRIAKCILADFTELGQTSVGSFAQSKSKVDFYLDSIIYIGDYICEVLNKIIKEAVQLQYGNVEVVPEIQVSGIKEKAGLVLAQTLRTLQSGNFITPDEELEDFIRDLYSLPVKDWAKEAKKKAESALLKKDNADLEPKKFSDKVLPERYKKLDETITYSVDDFNRLARNRLNMIFEKYIVDLKNTLEKGGNIAEIKLSGVSDYYKAIEQFLMKYTLAGFESVKDTVKNEKVTKLLADKKGKRLPDAIVNKIASKAKTIADGQINKIFTAANLTTMTAQQNKLSIAKTISEAEKSIDDYIDNDNNLGGSVVGIQALNEGRDVAFTEFKDDIRGFRYVSVLDSHTTNICSALNDATWKIEDDELYAQYHSPNHFGCRSIIEPVLYDEPEPVWWFPDLTPDDLSDKNL